MKEDHFVDQSGTIESKSTKSIKQEESDLDRVFEDMKDESNPTQTPITENDSIFWYIVQTNFWIQIMHHGLLVKRRFISLSYLLHKTQKCNITLGTDWY